MVFKWMTLLQKHRRLQSRPQFMALWSINWDWEATGSMIFTSSTRADKHLPLSRWTFKFPPGFRVCHYLTATCMWKGRAQFLWPIDFALLLLLIYFLLFERMMVGGRKRTETGRQPDTQKEGKNRRRKGGRQGGRQGRQNFSSTGSLSKHLLQSGMDQVKARNQELN